MEKATSKIRVDIVTWDSRSHVSSELRDGTRDQKNVLPVNVTQHRIVHRVLQPYK